MCVNPSSTRVSRPPKKRGRTCPGKSVRDRLLLVRGFPQICLVFHRRMKSGTVLQDQGEVSVCRKAARQRDKARKRRELRIFGGKLSVFGELTGAKKVPCQIRRKCADPEHCPFLGGKCVGLEDCPCPIRAEDCAGLKHCPIDIRCGNGRFLRVHCPHCSHAAAVPRDMYKNGVLWLRAHLLSERHVLP
jgi:hypothetical protein